MQSQRNFAIAWPTTNFGHRHSSRNSRNIFPKSDSEFDWGDVDQAAICET